MRDGFLRNEGFLSADDDYRRFFPEARGRLDPWTLLRSGGAALMTAMGLPGGTAPTSMWILDSATSISDLVGSNTLTGTSLAAATDSKLGGACLEWDNNSADLAEVASDATFDVALTSVAILWVGLFTSAPGATRNVVAKRNATDGYQIRLESGVNLRANAVDASAVNNAVTTLGTYADGNAICCMGGYDASVTAGEVFIVTDREARVQADNTVVASLTTTAKFGLGVGGGANSAPMHVRLCAIWMGAGAEQGFSRAHMQALRAYLGI